MLNKVRALHLLHQINAPADVPAAGLLAVDRLADEPPGPCAGVVVVALQFLLDNSALLVDLYLLELRIEEHIGGHVERRLKAVERHQVPVAGELLVGVGVQGAPRAFDLLRDHGRVGAPFGALEDHVLQEVRNAVDTLRF